MYKNYYCEKRYVAKLTFRCGTVTKLDTYKGRSSRIQCTIVHLVQGKGIAQAELFTLHIGLPTLFLCVPLYYPTVVASCSHNHVTRVIMDSG